MPKSAPHANQVFIELTSPQSVNGRRAAFQSLWLLVRMQHAHEAGAGVVRLADLRGEVSDASTLRMVASSDSQRADSGGRMSFMPLTA